VCSKLRSLDQVSPTHAAYCDNQQAYPDPDYKEPLALTLFDQARSTDPLIAAAAAQAIEKLQAEARFAFFWRAASLSAGTPGCFGSTRRGRKRSLQCSVRTASPLPSRVHWTPDAMRTIIRPQVTPNGDLYRVQVSIPDSDAAALTCLAKVFRLVNIQDDAATVSPPADVDKEFDVLKTRFAGKTRYVGWYSKIFQRDLLVGAHQCGTAASAPI
jgi:hypothetical protein